jgi:hypothetical protein
MSLDVALFLKSPNGKLDTNKGSGIYIREDGQTKEVTREEWDERFPNREPVVIRNDDSEEVQVFEGNITHNLNKMAREAGVYMAMWRPKEIEITTAKQLIEPLRDGLARLQTNPEHFRKFNPDNGWGTYEGLVDFVVDYLSACEKYPDAEIWTWR